MTCGQCLTSTNKSSFKSFKAGDRLNQFISHHISISLVVLCMSGNPAKPTRVYLSIVECLEDFLTPFTVQKIIALRGH